MISSWGQAAPLTKEVCIEKRTVNVHVPRGSDLIERRLGQDREDVGLDETLWPRNGAECSYLMRGSSQEACRIGFHL